MATQKSADLDSRPRHLGQYGEANSIKTKIAVAVGVLTGDILRGPRIPAGFEIHNINIANDDLDANGSPTLVFRAGYTLCGGDEGSMANNDAYFAAAGQTQLQAASDGKDYAKFDPLLCTQDVWIDLLANTGAATNAAGSVWVTVTGRNVGVK